MYIHVGYACASDLRSDGDASPIPNQVACDKVDAHVKNHDNDWATASGWSQTEQKLAFLPHKEQADRAQDLVWMEVNSQ